MRPLRDHVIFVARFVAVNGVVNPSDIRASQREPSGYGVTSRPKARPFGKSSGTKSEGGTGATNVPEDLLPSTATPSATTEADPLFNQALAVTVIPYFAAEGTSDEDLILIKQYLSLQVDECHAKKDVHYAIGTVNANNTVLDLDHLQSACDQCDCQKVIASLSRANITVSKNQTFDLFGYMNTLLLANHWWQKLAIPVVIFVTNIDCDELTTYPGLQDILEDDTQADYGDTILMNNVRVQLIWIDPGNDWQTKCDLSSLLTSGRGYFRLKTVPSLTALVRDMITTCPRTGQLSTTRSTTASTTSTSTSTTARTTVGPPTLMQPVKKDSNGDYLSNGALIAIICLSVIVLTAFVCCGYLAVRRNYLSNCGSFNKDKIVPRFPAIPVIAPSFQTKATAPPKDPCEVDEKRLMVNEDEVLGSGAFAVVCKGCLRGPTLPGERTQSTSYRMNEVAVKMLKKQAADYFRVELEREIEFMKTLGSHPHVLQMVGYVSSECKPLLLLEYCPDGDLLSHLRKHRECVKLFPGEPCTKQINTCVRTGDLLSYAWQIADGMTYLSAKKFIHRDLAARNVLVNKQCLKIADFGLTRYSDDSLYTTKSGRLPIKWMSPEALKRAEFSTASDIWSYGVLLYEIFSAGNMPYPTIHPSEMLTHLEAGNRLERPEHASDEMYSLMQLCWSLDPTERPLFDQLRSEIQVVLECVSPSYGYLEM